ELWKSDGTGAGTEMVKDIWPGSTGSYMDYLTDVNGTLFFTAGDPNGNWLWKSGGSEETTVVVSHNSHMFGYQNLTNVNGTLFFVAFAGGGSFGLELCKSDGTEAGTVMVKDINPGFMDAFLMYQEAHTFADVNGTLFFLATDGTNGDELWKSVGTEAGTVMVKDIQPGGGGSYPKNLTNVNGILFFTAIDPNDYAMRLWKSDGTEAGTVMVSSIGRDPGPVTDVNGTLFFADYTEPNGYELWQTDGTVERTVMVGDIYPGPWPASSNPTELTNINSALLFSATEGTHGRELWIYVNWLCSEPIEGDVNNDCQVDFRDFSLLASNWLSCNRKPDYLCGM
ncbi:MAG TPA: ELWxxDGT repeat protein, partial [Sedimentisphaerales bacterium]|nr:ELWxxDGT repeat protein [Sedimentisphaerales bacterium]